MPVSGALPVPAAGYNRPVAPPAPVVPAIPVPSAPGSGAVALPAIEPVAGPRVPDAGLIGDASGFPAVPPIPVATAPAELPPLPLLSGGKVPVIAEPAPGADSIPPVKFPSSAIEPPKPQPVPPPAPVTLPQGPELKPVEAVGPIPKLPVPPTGSDVPVAPVPPAGSGLAVPPLPIPGGTVEPPKAQPLPLPTPVAPPAGLDSKPPVPAIGTGTPAVPQPVGIAPPLPPIKSVEPVQPMRPTKPDSDLKPSNTPNTLNPTVSPIAPIVPNAPGRDVPGTQVDRPKAPDTVLGPSEKYVFPIPARPATPDPVVPTPRDDTMYKLTTTAAFAVLGGALMAAEKVSALPAIPLSALVPAPGSLVKADEKTDAEKLRDALKRIEDLEKKVERLSDMLYGKRDSKGILLDPTAPGSLAEVTKLKDDLDKLEKELKALKSAQQTVQKPALAPEVKPKGIVKVVNEYPVEIAMLINDRSHRIAPNTKVEVEVPAGRFTYQLLQSGAAATESVIKDKETVTLRIK
ncbi:hypothetical protein FTUN_6559 [Frigoriglobus tundricola]|uniref:Uncharacterized protein n=2 Tax=Frigoriglobus tundricola TaxID=2774151 RepID=A0A6M5YZK5_9BACT|nr:hypothetical protein FTUN_6559 [Frigoriglobus tundricola]